MTVRPRIRISPLRWGVHLHWFYVHPRTRAMHIASSPAVLMDACKELT